MTVASQLKQTLAGLKGAESTLSIYSLQTRSKEAVEVYKEALHVTGKVIKDIEDRIKVLELEEPQYKGF